MLLALDQSTVTGSAWGIPGCDMPRWCTVRFKGDAPGEVLSRFAFWLRDRLHDLKPAHVVRENVYFPRPRGADAKGPPPPPINIATLGRLLAIAETIDSLCWEVRIPCFEVPPAETTRRFLGPVAKLGRADKKAAYIARCAEFGWAPVSTDEADALGIWAAAESVIAPEAAARRRAARGMELTLPGAAPKRRERPASTNREAPISDEDESSDDKYENS